MFSFFSWVAAVWNWIVGFASSFWSYVWDLGVYVVEYGFAWTVDQAGNLFAWADLDFSFIDGYDQYYDVVGFFVPWKSLIGVMAGVLAAVAIIRLLRWIKAFIPTIAS